MKIMKNYFIHKMKMQGLQAVQRTFEKQELVFKEKINPPTKHVILLH
jgi:hypothetical protein